MPRYHIDKNGNPAQCRAQSDASCGMKDRIGSHYDSPEQARTAAEHILSQQYSETFTGYSKKQDPELAQYKQALRDNRVETYKKFFEMFYKGSYAGLCAAASLYNFAGPKPPKSDLKNFILWAKRCQKWASTSKNALEDAKALHSLLRTTGTLRLAQYAREAQLDAVLRAIKDAEQRWGIQTGTLASYDTGTGYTLIELITGNPDLDVRDPSTYAEPIGKFAQMASEGRRSSF